MNKIPFVSIIVCTHNGENQIGECLKGLLKQDYPKDKYEIIVVDDGSTDRTGQIISRYPVKWVRHIKNKGLSAARNTGLSQAKGKIYVCFDDDCIAAQSWLTNLIDLYKIPETIGAGGFIKPTETKSLMENYISETGYGNPAPLNTAKSRHPLVRFMTYVRNMIRPATAGRSGIFDVHEIYGLNSSFLKSVLIKVGGWDETLSGDEDTDLCRRIHLTYPDKSFRVSKNAEIFHNHKAGFIDFINRPFKRGTAVFKYYQKKSTIPPVFPFPLIIIIFSLLFLKIHLLLTLGVLLFFPQLLYFWWPLKLFKKRKSQYLFFPYIQFCYELMTIAGLIRGFAICFPINKSLLLNKILFPVIFLSLLYMVDIILTHQLFYFPLNFIPLLFFLIGPGYLFIRILKLNLSFGEKFSYAVVLSISCLIFVGLGINIFLPYFNITKPLSPPPLLFSLNIFCLLLLIIVLLRNNVFNINFNFPKINILTLFFAGISLLFPILNFTGAILLNNGGPNTLTFITLAGIGIYVLAMVFLRRRIEEYVFPIALFMIGLSLLFMFSMRSAYLTGWDIQSEYRVFQLTKQNYYWLPSNTTHAYNSTLSITILPTIISDLFHINDEYIFKIIYPVVFSFSGIGIYYLLRRNLSATESFLAAFFFIAQFQFMQQMPALARQQIAFLMFIFSLLILFDSVHKPLVKKIIFLVLGLTLVVAHYSTAYISITLFLLTYMVTLVLKIFYKLNRLPVNKIKTYLSFPIICILLLFTIFWYGSYTGVGSYLAEFSKNAVRSFPLIFEEGKSGQVNQSQPDSEQIYTSDDVQAYQANIVDVYHSQKLWLNYYPKTVYEKYSVFPVYLPFYIKNPVLQQIFFIFSEISQKFIKLLILFGIIYVCFIYVLKKKLIINLEWIFMSIGFLILMVLIIKIPFISSLYGIDRLYQQSLVLLTFFLIVILVSVFKSISLTVKYLFLTCLLIFYFFSYSGCFSLITGSNPDTMNLNNTGEEYERFYIYDAEVKAAQWLEKNYILGDVVYADIYGALRLQSATRIENGIMYDLIPAVIANYSYVYATHSNYVSGEVRVDFDNKTIIYNFPKDFLNNNKNIVYSNGTSVIYK